MTRIEPEASLSANRPGRQAGQGRVRIYAFTNLYGCEIGDDVQDRHLRRNPKRRPHRRPLQNFQPHLHLRRRDVEDEVFVGHNVTFINDLYPAPPTARAACKRRPTGNAFRRASSAAPPSAPARRSSAASPSAPGVIGAGSVVTRDVPADAVVAGNPARVIIGQTAKKETIYESSLPGSQRTSSTHPRAIDAAIRDVIDSNAFAGGPFVALLNANSRSIAVPSMPSASATAPMPFGSACWPLGVGPGDEVITVPSTFMATAEAISYCGARPKFVDIDEQTYTMDPACWSGPSLREPRPSFPFILFGQCADMDPILEIANKHGIPVVEDACQAHGALTKAARPAPGRGWVAFSFYPGKNLGALGEAGGM
jgi:hypothetical protein